MNRQIGGLNHVSLEELENQPIFVSLNHREQWKKTPISLLFASSKELQESNMENKKMPGGDRICDRNFRALM